MASDNHSTTRLDVLIGFAIAIVSITTALITWRASFVASSAGDANHRGLLDGLKKEAAASEDLRALYQEATFAQNYAAYAAQLDSLADSDDEIAVAQAKQLKQFLLPSLSQMAILSTNPAYLKKDGTFNLEKRLADITAEDPDLAKLDPTISFIRADQYSNEQRWLTVDIVLLVLALFWLTVAQIAGKRLRLVTLAIGGLVYLVSLVWFGMVELVFIISRGVL